jgi:hypothetical protein
MNAIVTTFPKPPPQMRTGDVIGWVVVCPQTGEWIMRCDSRSEAREMAHASGARIAKLEVAK